MDCSSKENEFVRDRVSRFWIFLEIETSLDPDFTLESELDGVRDQVDKDLLKASLISLELFGHVLSLVDNKLNALLRHLNREHVFDLLK